MSVKEMSEETTSEEDLSPLKVMIDTISFPAGIKRKRNYYPVKSSHTLVAISENATIEQYGEFIERNIKLESLFVFLGGVLYLEDPLVAPIHEMGLQYFGEAINDYNRSARAAYPNIPKRIILNVGQQSHESPNFGAMPDIGISTKDRTVNECNVIFEISYGVGLKKTSEKIENYFVEFAGISEAIVVDIFYEWQYDHLPNGSRNYNRNDGKMICYHYRRVDFLAGQSIKPSRAISFGNSAINNDDVNDAMVITGIDQENIRGHGIPNDPPCDHAGIVLYEVTISGRALLTADPNDTTVQCITGHFLNQLPQELDLQFDLFEFKELVVEDGLNAMDNLYRVVAH